jgi:putative flippase GtrA
VWIRRPDGPERKPANLPRSMAFDVFRLLPKPLRTPLIEKLIKYCFGSASGVVTDAVVLVLAKEVLDQSNMTSHLLAVTVATVPNYTINRYWTWQQSGKNRLWGEVIPFWVMALLGFAMSTLFVSYADHQWGTTPAVLAANLAGFGVVWPAKFLVLDRLMWKVAASHLDEDGTDASDVGDAGDPEPIPAPVEP